MHEVGELARLGRKVTDIVELKGFGGVLDEVKHIVHPGDQAVDVLPIQWRYECPVEKREGLVSHLVGAVFELDNAGDALTAVMFLAREAPQQLAEHRACGDYQLRVLIKEIEEPTFTRHQLGKKLHARIPSASDRAVRNCAAWSGIRTAAACFHPLLSQLIKSKHIVREALAPAQSGV
jgi:hypothetical protein